MKRYITKSSFIIGLTLATLVPVSADNPSQSLGTPTHELQDSQRAARYFEDKASYETNAFSLNKIINSKTPNVIVVDVRTSNDYAKGHIPGAINIPFDKYNSFEDTDVNFPGLHKDRLNVIYCYGLGCNLGPKAAAKFASLGYPVKELIGGYMAWTDGKLAIETGSAK